ncbi:hypothetical protein HK405_002279, partial [Cladochytrium tenue]
MSSPPQSPQSPQRGDPTPADEVTVVDVQDDMHLARQQLAQAGDAVNLAKQRVDQASKRVDQASNDFDTWRALNPNNFGPTYELLAAELKDREAAFKDREAALTRREAAFKDKAAELDKRIEQARSFEARQHKRIKSDDKMEVDVEDSSQAHPPRDHGGASQTDKIADTPLDDALKILRAMVHDHTVEGGPEKNVFTAQDSMETMDNSAGLLNLPMLSIHGGQSDLLYTEKIYSDERELKLELPVDKLLKGDHDTIVLIG